MRHSEWEAWILAATGAVCWLLSSLGGALKNNDNEPFGIREVLSVVLIFAVCLFVLWLTGAMK